MDVAPYFQQQEKVEMGHSLLMNNAALGHDFLLFVMTMVATVMQQLQLVHN